MPDGNQIVRKGRKFDQVIEGARQVFLKDGFEGASVDDIAKTAGVSKATLYSYFPDKRHLFMEVAKTECQRQAQISMDMIDDSASAEVVLGSIATQFIEFITSDFGQRIFRICVGEADRFPELGREFYESGPKLIQNRVVTFLKCACARRELAIEDHHLAADQFAELCKADLFPRMVFNISKTFTVEEKQRVAKGAVETFIARYGSK